MADHERKKQQKSIASRREFIAATALAGVGAGAAIAVRKGQGCCQGCKRQTLWDGY